ncbi:MAG: cell division/cell wall cluster transcriptional repressor MraZ [Legionellales bacterium]|nr:cell division/cell wall cluster transcriptional repressor MraZ [Legionellales bacterium]
MFRGINAINMDAKGRMAMPTRYRPSLENDSSNHIVVTIDTESPCLLLYPLTEWEVIEQKIEALPSFNPAARRIQRLLMGHATECELDTNGRILVPPLLRDHADLDKKVMLVGQGKKFEIWSEMNWQAQREVWLASEKDGDAELPPELETLSL